MQSEYHEASQLRRLAEPLYKVKGWMKFAGVMSIISGGLQVLSLWGILIAWLPIWMGIILVSASNYLEKAYEQDQEQDMVASLSKMGTYFKLFGVFLIVLMVVMVVGILAAIFIPAYLGYRDASMGM